MSIWKNKPTIEILQQMSKGNMLTHIGIEFIEVGDDFIKAKMPVDYRTHQPLGLLHGGASVVLAESLGSSAGSFCVNTPDEYVVGIEINANHIKSVRSGFVIGIAQPIHIGKHTHIWSVKIKNEQEQLVCISRITLQVLQSKK